MSKKQVKYLNIFIILLKITVPIIWIISLETIHIRELTILLLYVISQLRKYYKHLKKNKIPSSDADNYPASDKYFPSDFSKHYFIGCKGAPYYQKGHQYALKSKPKKAMDKLYTAIELADNARDKSMAYFFLGYCYEQLCDNYNALSTYEKAVNIDSNNLPAWKYLGIMYAQNGRAEESILCYKNIIAIKPDVPATLVSLAYAYIRLEDYHLAIKVLEDALTYMPTFINTLTAISIAYAGIGDRDNVDKYMKQLIEQKNHPDFNKDKFDTLKDQVEQLLQENN